MSVGAGVGIGQLSYRVPVAPDRMVSLPLRLSVLAAEFGRLAVQLGGTLKHVTSGNVIDTRYCQPARGVCKN
jgi:hypothetical protein